MWNDFFSREEANCQAEADSESNRRKQRKRRFLKALSLDFAEDQAKQRKQVFLKDWRERLDSFRPTASLGVAVKEGALWHQGCQSIHYHGLRESRNRITAGSGLHLTEPASPG
jgi:hypothetical protein